MSTIKTCLKHHINNTKNDTLVLNNLLLLSVHILFLCFQKLSKDKINHTLRTLNFNLNLEMEIQHVYT